ncbi:MAG: hypothetical protein ACK58X_20505 [Planctomycetota bacterium]
MGGGIAVRGDMVAIAWSAAKGHVFLVDVAACRPLASWQLPDGPSGWSDAAGVALDERYHVYVADPCNDRVLQFDPFGRLVRSYGAPAPARGDAGRDRAGVLDRPHAVAVRGDIVAIAGGDQPRRCGVQRFTRQGALLRPLRCHGDAAMAWSAPRGLAADAAGFAVADTLRGEVATFRGDGTFLRAGDVAAGTPTAVVRGVDGSLWCVAGGVLRHLNGGGADLPLAGDLAARAADVLALAVDAAGRLYVLDRAGERVRRYLDDGRDDGEVAAIAPAAGGAPRAE